MSTSFDPLGIRNRLGRDLFRPPIEHGDDGWAFISPPALPSGHASVIVSCGPAPSAFGVDHAGGNWWHASISRRDRMPDYADLVLLHHAVWPNGYAFQVFAPPAKHINLSAHVLHLWGRPDGRNVLPDFGYHGTI
jgi:hypothetical protein